MGMNFEYYYNNVPGDGLCRNNLIYTSLISSDKKTFCQWYHNDTDYHRGQNQVVDPDLMEEKWEREIKYITLMAQHYPFLVPEILDIDYTNKKLYLAIDGVDLWQRALDLDGSLYSVMPNWEQQILTILIAHRTLGLYKYSMHPSSYFIVNGNLRSINYFFTYHENEPDISIKDVESHISEGRKENLRNHMQSLGMDWDQPHSFKAIHDLCWDSFSTNYPADFVYKAKVAYD